MSLVKESGSHELQSCNCVCVCRGGGVRHHYHGSMAYLSHHTGFNNTSNDTMIPRPTHTHDAMGTSNRSKLSSSDSVDSTWWTGRVREEDEAR